MKYLKKFKKEFINTLTVTGYHEKNKLDSLKKAVIIHFALSFFIFALDAFNKIKRHMVINDI